MTDQEAAEILELENRYPWSMANSDLREAVRKGIRALYILIETDEPIGKSHTHRIFDSIKTRNRRTHE